MLKDILYLFLYVLIIIISIFVLYILIKTLSIGFKHRISHRKKHHKLKFRWKHFLYHVRDTRYINTVEFIKWVLIDLLRGLDRYKLFGIWCFTGYYGEGKSLGAVNFAFNIKEKNPQKDIKIFSNFNVKGQDGKIECWQDLIELPKDSIVIFDEIQSTFTSQKYSDFPIELLWKLTQCRKHGLAIFCTSPVYSRMSIQLRESTDYVIESKNRFGLNRWFTYNFYHAPEYEAIVNVTGINGAIKKKQNREFKYTLIAQDKNYKKYNTTEQIDRWDIEDKNNKKIKKYDYKKLKNELLKEIEYRLKKVS